MDKDKIVKDFKKTLSRENLLNQWNNFRAKAYPVIKDIGKKYEVFKETLSGRNLLDELNNVKAELSSAKKNQTAIVAENTSLKKEISDLEKSVGSYKSKGEVLQNICTDLNHKADELQKTLEKERTKHGEVIEKNKKQSSDKIKVLRKEKSDLGKMIQSLNANIQELDLAKSELIEKNTGLESRVAELYKDNGGLNTRISELNKQGEELNSQINELNSNNEKLNFRISELTEENAQFGSKIETLKKEKIGLEGQIQSLEETIADKNREAEITKHELQEAKEEFKRVVADLTEERANRNNLQEEKEALEVRVGEMEENNNEMQSRINALEDEKSQLQSELENLKGREPFAEEPHQSMDGNEPDDTPEVAIDTPDGKGGEGVENIIGKAVECGGVGGDGEDSGVVEERGMSGEESEGCENKGNEGVEQKDGEEEIEEEEGGSSATDGDEEEEEDEEVPQDEGTTDNGGPSQGEENTGGEEESIKSGKNIKGDERWSPKRGVYRGPIFVDSTEAGEIMDLPDIKNASKRGVERAIKYVIDKRDKIDERIYADDYFEHSTAEEIARDARQLAESNDIKHEDYWVCGKCGERVKIARRVSNGRETYYFTHARRDPEYSCPWRSEPSKHNNYGDTTIEDPEITERLKGVKEHIYNLLRSDTSWENGITNVQMDKIVRSRFPYTKWRRPDLSFTYENKVGEEREIVIQLQKASHNVGDLADRDVFYRLNDKHIIWIFGGEYENTYAYLNTLPYQNTLFHNHRNVFIFDKEAQEESNKRDELVLKCNWLGVDDKWNFNLDKNGTNGKLTTINELIFDDEYCKPYHYDANTPYFEKHPEAKIAFEKTLETRDELLSKLEQEWFGNKRVKDAQGKMRKRGDGASPYRDGNVWGFRYDGTTLIQPIFTTEPQKLSNGYYVVRQGSRVGLLNKYARVEIDWDGNFRYDIYEYNEITGRCIVTDNWRYGVANKKGDLIIGCSYESVSSWIPDVYRVKSEGKWALCNVRGEIMSLWYNSIGKMINGKAEASFTPDGEEWKEYRGYIDSEGGQIVSIKGLLPFGGHIIETFERMGIVGGNGEELLPTEYDDILPWHEMRCRINKGGKWGVIDIETKEVVLPMEYDSIGDIVNGAAAVECAGRKSMVDVDGKERAEESIVLQNGLRKICLAGKWGISDENGTEIIAPKYDEIGTFRERFIGIINGHVIKLNAYYRFPVPMSAKYVGEAGKFYIFEVGGVKLRLNKNYLNGFLKKGIKEICGEDNYCHQIAFMNILFSCESYVLRYVDEQGLKKPLSHGDADSDFEINTVITGAVTKRDKRKVFVTFPNGKITKVPMRFFKKVGKTFDDYPANSQIKLKKVGFDDELDQTIWDIVE